MFMFVLKRVKNDLLIDFAFSVELPFCFEFSTLFKNRKNERVFWKSLGYLYACKLVPNKLVSSFALDFGDKLNFVHSRHVSM